MSGVNLGWVNYFVGFSLRLAPMLVLDAVREGRRSDIHEQMLLGREEELRLKQVEFDAYRDISSVIDEHFELHRLRLQLKEGEDFIDQNCDESYQIAWDGWNK